ncbi:DNA internalization-related competence protein ComEC/Rec2 [Companilactobacillus huachuanensis]|uniref:DNA internalization-related competence protein ComEC/Rec2 n=1 Tax=Companilactobacillus huachuanensis TaxID=2559914 RepID=A0ABW1RJ17_9LACO|nr:DNA internalization-related competence protein ComEC/Rec2 [Companilactobacillus huachuanensis]
MRNGRLLIVVGLVAGIFLIRCQLLEQSLRPMMPHFSNAIFSPDTFSINGDLLSGQLRNDEQTVRFVYKLKSKQEQAAWEQQTDIVEAPVKIKKVTAITGPRNIGEFNFKKYAYHKNIHYTVELNQIGKVSTYHAKTVLDKINVLRIHIIQHLTHLPKWLRIHAQSLIVGYTANPDKNFLKILSVLGVIHLFSLSGLHVLILLTIIKKITSYLRIPVEWINDIMLILLPCYGILVGSKSGIWRAIVLAMVGIILGRFKVSWSKLDVFSLTMMICLMIYPFAIIEMGGQLSFLLSFAILYLYKESNFLLTVFKMNLVSLPLISFYTFQFNWLTLLANVMFIPLFTYIILPVTLVSSLTVDWKFWQIPNYFFEKFYSFLEMLTMNPTNTFITGKFPIAIVIILVVIVLFYIESKTFWNKYLWQYTVIFVGCVILNKFPLFGSVSLIDVGQGDSILVTTPLQRKTFLIDVAGKSSFPSKPWAKRTSSNQVENSTIPFLKSQGISYIDKIFISHKDVDHIGNLDIMLNKFPVKEVNFGIGLEDNPRIKRAIKQHPEIKFKNLRQGDIVDTGVIKWQVLWPKKKGIGENGDSLTLFAKIKNKKWLFPGDLDSAGEKSILNDKNFQIDYLKLGHHGSKTATSNDLLEKTKPKLGFISAGVNNRYGHPNQETLQRLQKHRVQYFNTADYGMINWYYFSYNDEEKITTFLKGDLLENNRTKK